MMPKRMKRLSLPIACMNGRIPRDRVHSVADQVHDAGLHHGPGTEVIAMGKPLSPSATAVRISLKPRALSSLTAFSQNLALKGLGAGEPAANFEEDARWRYWISKAGSGACRLSC